MNLTSENNSLTVFSSFGWYDAFWSREVQGSPDHWLTNQQLKEVYFTWKVNDNFFVFLKIAMDETKNRFNLNFL